MKNKELIILFIIVAIIIAIGGYFLIRYLKDSKINNDLQEYTPQEEINDEQLRQTIVSLYFLDKDTQNISVEARLIDASKLINNPYKEIVELLIAGPKNDKLEKLIPNDVKINNANIKNGCVTIDMSKEFLNYNNNDELKNKIINSIVNSLTELTEVNSIKILINGEENENLKDTYIRI